MRIALISDIHANLNALEAVLAQIDQEKPDAVFSLGDQVGMGPKPTEVLDVLRARRIPCLLGNHEMRVLALREDTRPEYREDINYAFARWNTAALEGYDLDFPMERSLDTPAGRLMLRHAGRDNPFLPIRPEKGESLAKELEETEARALAVGHLHDTFSFLSGGKLLVVVGAVSTAENGVPGLAQYMMVEATRHGFAFCPRVAPYDVWVLRDQFIQSGLVACDPVMARLLHEALRLGRDRVSHFVGEALERARLRGSARVSPEDWAQTARSFAWMEPGLDKGNYWK